MSTYQTEFRASRVAWIVITTSFAIAIAFAICSLIWGAPLWRSVLFWALSFGALVEIVKVSLTKVELMPDGVHFRGGFQRKFVPRSEIASVNWEKGAGVALKLVNGNWQKLPEVGRGAQAVANSIRAWLRDTNSAASPSAVV